MKWRISIPLLALSLNASAVDLTWEDCLRYTMEGNPQLESSKNEWLATQENERVALAGYLPSLSASTSYTQTGTTGAGGGVVANGVVIGGNGSTVNKNYLASLNFSQNIFNGLEDSSKIEQAKWRTKNSFWAYVTTKSTLSFNLKDAFSNLVYTQESLALAQSILERRESNYKLVSVRYDSGRENKGSVMLAEAYYQQAQLDLTRAKDAHIVAQSRLKTLMNKDQFDTLNVSGAIPLEQLEFKNKGIEDLAIETPAYNQAFALEKVAAEQIDISRSAFIPSLDLTGNVVKQGPSYFPERERWAVALTLTIPIFDGLRDMGTYKGSVLSKYAAEGKKKNTLLELLPRLREAQNLARQSDIKYSIDEKFKNASGTRAEIARAKYNNGLITFEDWDIIENELIQRQTSFLQSKRDRVVRYATWENLLGRGAIP